MVFTVLAVLLGVALIALATSVRVLREYERAVVFRLGRLLGQKGPGIVLLIPGVDRMVRVDLRTVTFDVPPQDLITRDNVPAKVNAVTYFRVVDPIKSVVEVERYRAATSQIAQTTLRSVLGKADLDMLLAEREKLNEALQKIIDEQTDPWGIKVTTVEIKDVGIPQGTPARQRRRRRGHRAHPIDREASPLHPAPTAAILTPTRRLIGPLTAALLLPGTTGCRRRLRATSPMEQSEQWSSALTHRSLQADSSQRRPRE